MEDESLLLVLSALRRMLQDEVISEHELEMVLIADLLEGEEQR